MVDIEVLIIGGGPAGLLAASLLAEKHQVALIDRSRLERTTKYWVTTKRRLVDHHLAHCQLNEAGGAIVGTFLGGRVRVPGDFAVVDEEALLHELVDRCRERKVLLSERCTLINLFWTPEHIQVLTTGDSYRARLVVDASGTASPIASTFRLHRIDGFFSVFGAHLNDIQLQTEDIILAYANTLGDPPPILEVIPTGRNSAYCSIFIYSKILRAPHALDTAFRSQCTHNPFFELTARTRVVRGKVGTIAIGQRRQRQLPGVISIGEAGLVQPPLLGTAFNEILQFSRRACSHISQVLRRESGVPKALNFAYPLLKQTQDRLQLTLARVLLRENVEALDWLVHFMSKLPPRVVFNLISNELTWLELVAIAMKLPNYAVSHGLPAQINSAS